MATPDRSPATKILERAAEVVERGWTVGVSARDACGVAVRVDDARAVCWCADGALERARFELELPIVPLYIAFERLDQHLGVGHINWNDAVGRTAAEVAGALRAAARKLEVAT